MVGVESTKLTAVTVTYQGRQAQAFLDLPLNAKGQPVLPTDTLNKMLDDVSCRERGATFTFG